MDGDALGTRRSRHSDRISKLDHLQVFHMHTNLHSTPRILESERLEFSNDGHTVENLHLPLAGRLL